MKHYYALEQTHSNISIWSQYGRPTLHVFNSKKERDLNHSIDVTTSNIARKAYTKVFDGVRTFMNNVIIHN